MIEYIVIFLAGMVVGAFFGYKIGYAGGKEDTFLGMFKDVK